MHNPTRTPRYSLNEVARIGGVNPSVFRNWQRSGISFFNFEGPATPAGGPGQAHKLSGRIAMYMLLSLLITKTGVSPTKAHEIALQYTHMSSLSVSNVKKPKPDFAREPSDNYSTAPFTNLIICPATEQFKYYPSNVSPTAEDMRMVLGEYLHGIAHIDMNMFRSWADMALNF